MSTAGSDPAFTKDASIGASLYLPEAVTVDDSAVMVVATTVDAVLEAAALVLAAAAEVEGAALDVAAALVLAAALDVAGAALELAAAEDDWLVCAVEALPWQAASTALAAPMAETRRKFDRVSFCMNS